MHTTKTNNPALPEALFAALCSGVLLAYSLYHQRTDRNITGLATSPYLLPILLGVLGLLLAATLLRASLRPARSETAAESPQAAPAPAGRARAAARPGSERTAAAFALVTLAYILLLPRLHFLPATLLALPCLLLLLGERSARRIALVSCGTALAVYALFGLALHVRLP